MVPSGHWTQQHIDKMFAMTETLSTLEQAEANFKNKSPSLLAAKYKAANINKMILTHLNHGQHQALWHILQKHSFLFSRKHGKLPGKPVHLELNDPNVKPYWQAVSSCKIPPLASQDQS